MLPVVVALSLLVACERGGSQPTAVDHLGTPTPMTYSAQEVEVVGPEGPEDCGPRAVGELVARFFAASNERDVDISAFFARDMEWYSVTDRVRDNDRRHFVSYGYDPDKLGAYFERRAEQNEELVLLEVDVQHDPDRQNVGHIAYTLERRADDLAGSQPLAHGKGAIDCDSGTIKVWSMVHPVRLQHSPDVCAGDAEPPRVALACARE